MKKKKKILTVSFLAGLLLLATAIPFACKRLSAYTQKRQALDVLAVSEYQSVFLSMYDISSFPTEAFTINKGIPTLKSHYSFQNPEEISVALKTIFNSGNDITNVFLGLEPLFFRQLASDDSVNLKDIVENQWLPYVDEHPQTTFDILFSFPSIACWDSLTESQRSHTFALCEQLVVLLGTRKNIAMYYVGGEDWLICNPSNYINSHAVRSRIAEKIFLYTFCDGYFKITPENASEILQKSMELINAEIAAPREYPDLTQCELIFIGDSIIANDAGMLSIPDIITALSGAPAYNIAQGGTCAAQSSPGILCFPKMVEEFLTGKPENPDSVYGQGILQYNSSRHSGKKTCFIITFGLNDYFTGNVIKNNEDIYDIQSYTGSIRTGIAALKDAFPDAIYILMGPGQVTIYNNGKELINGKDQLIDYYVAATALANELGIAYLDLYYEFPAGNDTLTDVLLRDGTHYNEHGRFLLSQNIIAFLEDYLTSS
ncbi:MAG: SGNH/GDSL hydrolase family protein [Acetatifactor sp.]|nr:SGNH/GDSL hydrolase family protein [Acetatifactor sp.]